MEYVLTAKQAQGLAWANPAVRVGPWTYVDEVDGGNGRWTAYHTLVLRHEDGTLHGLDYETGLTEFQPNELPWEGEDDDKPMTIYPMEAYEVTRTRYRRVAVAK